MNNAKETLSPIPAEENGRFIERLKEIIGDKSVRSFAQSAKVAPNTLHNILDGGEPKRNNLINLAAVGGVTVEWLATGRGSKYYDDMPTPDDYSFTKVNLYSGDIGASGWNDDSCYLNEFAFSSGMISDAKFDVDNCAAIQVRGDGMVPTIPEDAIMLVDLSDNNISHDGVYVVQLANVLMPKRLQHHFNHSLLMKCDNKGYSDFEIPEDQLDNIKVIGRVIWYGTKI